MGGVLPHRRGVHGADLFIAHVYLSTAGHTPLAHIKAMITGWEEGGK